METEIVKAAIDILKSMESGEYISVWDLVKETNVASKAFMDETSNMMHICEEIFKKAEKAGIYLESLYGEDAVIGLPYNIPYTLKRKYNPNMVTKENCIGLSYREGGYMCCVPAINVDIDKSMLTNEEWDEVTTAVFDRAKVQNWYDKYENRGIMDGYYWNLEIRLKDGSSVKYDGSNEAPRGLKLLEKTIQPWSKGSFEELEFNEDEEAK